FSSFSGFRFFFLYESFIYWRLTRILPLFAGSLLISHWVMIKPLLQRMLGNELAFPQQVWSKLNLAWALFFIAFGLANIYIAFWLPQTLWLNFKVLGATALTLIFTLLSGVHLYRHLPRKDKP
uniref:septation protein IspZ n=1 Tax=Salmonella enterica TaxID=28901 RepID=UPI00398C49D2